MSLSFFQQVFQQENTRAFLLSTAKYTCACTALHLSLRPVVRKFKQIEPKSRGDCINRCLATVHGFISGACCTAALLFEEPFASYTRSLLSLDVSNFNYYLGHSSTLANILPLTIGYMLYDCGLMMIDSEVYMDLMVVHHVFSILLFPSALLSGRCQYYVLQLLSTEMTSVLLHPTMYFLPKFGLKGSTVHTISGLSLIGLFTLYRILPVPFLLSSFYGARQHFRQLSPGLKWAVVIGMPIPPMMNIFWYQKLVIGALKALGVIGGGKKIKPDTDSS